MKFLHTSDWHLGRSLYGRKRYDEFTRFLDWLVVTIEQQGIDGLLVAGDVFDTTTPSNRAQALYYRFLCRVSATCCRHVVVIAGNHDSPSFLNAPRELLRALNVHVVGAMTDDPADEVIVLSGRTGGAARDISPESGTPDLDHTAIVCAVPYLRDKDVRSVEPGETIDDKNRKLVEGIKQHYAEVVAVAQRKRDALVKTSSLENPESKIPIIAMGHLFTAGGKTVEGDGVRDLYVGSLAHMGEDVFPPSIDYLALGHLHVPQSVGSTGRIRYSGSPIPMGYGEATQEKQTVVIEFNTTTPILHNVPVPCFQPLVRIAGSLDHIHARVEQLKQEESRAWLEIEYTGRDIIANLRDRIEEALAGSAMEVRRIKNKRVIDRVIQSIREDETLDDLDPGDVFNRCLDLFDVPHDDRNDLVASYNEILYSFHGQDVNAE